MILVNWAKVRSNLFLLPIDKPLSLCILFTLIYGLPLSHQIVVLNTMLYLLMITQDTLGSTLFIKNLKCMNVLSNLNFLLGTNYPPPSNNFNLMEVVNTLHFTFNPSSPRMALSITNHVPIPLNKMA